MKSGTITIPKINSAGTRLKKSETFKYNDKVINDVDCRSTTNRGVTEWNCSVENDQLVSHEITTRDFCRKIANDKTKNHFDRYGLNDDVDYYDYNYGGTKYQLCIFRL